MSRLLRVALFTLSSLAFVALCDWAIAGEANMIEVRPTETEELLANPGMGWETFHRLADSDAALDGLPSSTAYFRWYWDQIEPVKDEINWNLVDTTLAKCRESGQKLAFRIMVYGTGRNYNFSPDWLQEEGYAGFEYSHGDGQKHWGPDLDDPDVLGRQLKLIRAFGERYDGHPDVAHVDIGSVGLWGEWHMSGTDAENPSETTCRTIIDTYFEAFPTTPMVMLIGPLEHLRYATDKGAGWRADCLGDMGGFTSSWSHMEDMYPQQIVRARIEDTWKTAPVAFETCWDMRKWHGEGWDVGYICDWALEQHASYINNKSAPLPEEVRPLVEALLRKLGYRFVLRALRHPAAVKAGGALAVETDWENVGVAPCYADYAPAVSLVNGDGERVAVQALDATTRDWLPGEFSVGGDLAVPAGTAAGEYTLAVGIIDPATGEPVVRLAVEGRDDAGWYPLSRVTVE